jgi:hypothetical protein
MSDDLDEFRAGRAGAGDPRGERAQHGADPPARGATRGAPPELARGIDNHVARRELEARVLGSEALFALRVRADPPPAPPSFAGPAAP